MPSNPEPERKVGPLSPSEIDTFRGLGERALRYGQLTDAGLQYPMLVLHGANLHGPIRTLAQLTAINLAELQRQQAQETDAEGLSLDELTQRAQTRAEVQLARERTIRGVDESLFAYASGLTRFVSEWDNLNIRGPKRLLPVQHGGAPVLQNQENTFGEATKFSYHFNTVLGVRQLVMDDWDLAVAVNQTEFNYKYHPVLSVFFDEVGKIVRIRYVHSAGFGHRSDLDNSPQLQQILGQDSIPMRRHRFDLGWNHRWVGVDISMPQRGQDLMPIQLHFGDSAKKTNPFDTYRFNTDANQYESASYDNDSTISPEMFAQITYELLALIPASLL